MTSSSVAPNATLPAPLVELRQWVTAALVATMWLEVLHGVASEAHASRAWVVAAAGLAAQLAFTAGEAAVAAATWRALGVPVRWRALAPRILAASAAEALAVSIASGRAELPRVLAVALAGPRAAAPPGPPHGAATAFAAFGVLALGRMLLSARLQADAARSSFARACAVVFALWAMSRLAMWWTVDLLQGRSFQP